MSQTGYFCYLPVHESNAAGSRAWAAHLSCIDESHAGCAAALQLIPLVAILSTPQHCIHTRDLSSFAHHNAGSSCARHMGSIEVSLQEHTERLGMMSDPCHLVSQGGATVDRVCCPLLDGLLGVAHERSGKFPRVYALLLPHVDSVCHSHSNAAISASSSSPSVAHSAVRTLPIDGG